MRTPVNAVMSSDQVTATSANATTVGGDFADFLNGTLIVPTEDATWSGNPYSVCSTLLLRNYLSHGGCVLFRSVRALVCL